MSEVISFNTDELAKPILAPEAPPQIFGLVHESHEILSKVLPEFDFANPPVNPNEFASTLVETCKAHNGYGLSANQCGFEHRVFVAGHGDNYVAYFNPEILTTSTTTSHMAEGCLSYPFLGLHITRPDTIVVKYQDFNGETHQETFDGLTARIIQHELDHLNGIVYTSRAKPLALQMSLKKRDKLMKKLRLK
ncbi:Def N-formylmethionyl-tRNA deformylase [uncultured Caudovirales phage]|uniref:Def N-formylmethionyl-tRNA deformylase n=1 Tax=uncultured Caudovirales phage TaxID=2100421 RepID=A0A6J5LIQ0_9CAUD|nr:Def N-formylmethionyl-tRNA deformylase [uncultured Caudovirales phage]